MWTAIRTNLLTLAFVLAVATPAHAAVLEPFTATYKATHGFLNLGEATFELSRDQGCWRWHGVAEPSGLASLLIGTVTDDSRFCVAGDGASRPTRFSHQEAGDAEDSYHLDFDWASGTVEYNSREPMTLPGDAVDPFLLQIAARRWLAGADDPANLPAREFVVVDENEIKRYRLAVSEGASVETGMGEFKTLRVARVDDSDEQLIFWVAPKLDYLPVKVEHRENGKTQIRFLLRGLRRQRQQGTI